MPIFAFSPGVHHAEFSANIRQYMTGTHVEVEALVTLMESSLTMEFNMAVLLLPVHSKCFFKKFSLRTFLTVFSGMGRVKVSPHCGVAYCQAH